MAAPINFQKRTIFTLLLIINILRNVLNKPIVGGLVVGPLETVNNFSYMVSLQEFQSSERNNHTGSYNHICGGILIESISLESFWKLFILTAAHCVLEKDIKNLAVVIGESDLKSQNIEVLPVSDIHIYEFNRYSIKNDIALIEVNSGPTKNYDFESIRPLKLSRNEFEPNFKASCMILGYGSTEYSGPISRYLRKASVNLITNSQCTNVLGFIMGPREGDNTICAIGEKQDTCQGDSGSGLICKTKKDKTDFLFALVSHGINCGGEGIPSVYTMVHKYFDWIDSIVQDN